MKTLVAAAVAVAVALAAPAFAQQGGSPPGSAPSRTSVPYSGGGIRGHQDALQPVGEGVLVTADEARLFEGEKGYGLPQPLRPRAVLPSIEVLRPTLAGDTRVKAPVAIAVQFKPQDAPIVPSSFRVFYGALRVDITERITKHVAVTPEGFSFDKAQLPPGKHRLVLRVEDEKQRAAEKELRFEVE